MEDNVNKAIYIGVFILIALSLFTAITIVFSYGQRLGESFGAHTDIEQNIIYTEENPEIFQSSKGTIFSGASVKSAVYRYQGNTKYIVNVRGKSGNLVIGNINNTALNSSGVIPNESIDKYIKSNKNYKSDVSIGSTTTINFYLQN